MKRFGREVLIVALAAVLAVLAPACGVTETGNPIPTGDVPDAAGESIYINDTYGVVVTYPTGWSVEEANEDSATFAGGELGSSATIEFSMLDPAPVSLAIYLAQEYPTRTFQPYSTVVLDGYVYDDPAIGPNGGDLMEYFFLVDDVLIHVTAEIFAEDSADFESLLDGIDSL